MNKLAHDKIFAGDIATDHTDQKHVNVCDINQKNIT